MREISIIPIVETGQAAVAHFICKGGKCNLCEEQAVDHPEIAFPLEGVFIRHDSFGRQVIDNTTAMFFNPGQPFEIEHPVAAPDHSWFISLSDPVFADAWRQFGAEDDYLAGDAFKRTSAPLAPEDWLRSNHLFDAIKKAPDALALQEHIFALLQWILPHALDGRPIENTMLERKAERVALAKVYMAENFREKVQLSDLVEVTKTSPFHLCRIFREETDYTLHDHLIRLRLRTALEALKDKSVSITNIAHALGFNSHSHFATCFQRELGMTPSAYRAPLG